MSWTRRRVLAFGLKLTGAASLLAVASPACGPADGDTDAGSGDIDASSPIDAGHVDGTDAGVVDEGDAGEVDAGEADAGEVEGADAGEPAICAEGASAVSITGNHGHSITVPKSLLELDGDELVSIRGGSTHGHTVTLISADKVTLLGGGSVEVTSTTDAGHSHVVTIRCV